MNLDTILNEVKRICKKYNARKVILFGSFAKGTATRFSDIDIAVSGVEKMDELRSEIEGILTLRSFDVVDLEHCENELLLEDIRKYGREIL